MTPSKYLKNCKLFIVKIVSFILVLETLASHVKAEVIVKNAKNETVSVIFDVTIGSSSPLPLEGLYGKLVLAQPEDACSPIDPPPSVATDVPWIALVRRYPCTFPTKINYALRAGFQGVIVYNSDKPVTNGTYLNNGSHLIAFAPDGGDILTANITNRDLSIGIADSWRLLDLGIPAVLIPKDDGLRLKKLFLYDKPYFVLITPPFEPNILSYLLPVAILIGIALIVMIIIMITKCLRDERRSRRNRLSSKHLKKLTVTKYHKGDHYDVCAICLEDYVDGEKVRELPCGHIYHLKCIDPWLVNNRRVCPVCKAKVILPGVVDVSSDSDDNTRANERTRLLEPHRNRATRRTRDSDEMWRSLGYRSQRRDYRTLDDTTATSATSAVADRRALGEGTSGANLASNANTSGHIRRNRTRGHRSRHRRAHSDTNRIHTVINSEESGLVTSEHQLLINAADDIIDEIQHEINANTSTHETDNVSVAIVEIENAAEHSIDV